MTQSVSFPHIGFDKVIQERYVKDVAGIRVVCYYKSDASKLWDLIKEESGYGLCHFDDPKEPATEAGIFKYPRLHLCVKLDDERLKLPEYSNLKNVPCEIQIGTILEEGWSDANHELIYKPESPMSDEDIKKLERVSYSNLLPCIKHTDGGFDELRKICKDIDFKHGGSKTTDIG